MKQEGCEIFGRFMIALIAQATQERAAIPEQDRLETLIYIDEAQDYFDQTIEHLLNTGRKYKVGITLAVQNLGQFDRSLRDTVMASTAIKLAGGASSSDASDLAKDMRTTPEFIQRVDKTPTHTSFMLYVRNEFSEAKDFRTRLGVLESEPKMTDADLKTLLATNREKYCAPYDHKLLTGSAVISESGVSFDLEPSKVL